MARRRSLLLWIGLALAIAGAILIAKPFAEEPLWVQWGLGFALFYVGLPIGIVGAASYFVGFSGGPSNPFSRPRSK